MNSPGSIRIHIEQRIAAMMGYRGGRLEGDEEKLDDVLFELESSHDELVTPYDATARNGRNKRPCASFIISQCLRGIFINQSKYALEMLKKYGLDQCDVVDIPMVGQLKLDEDLNGTLVDPTRYRGMVISLMYLIVNHPDLVFVVCICAMYQAKPTEKHLTTMHSKLTDYGFNFNKIPLYPDSKSVIALSCNTVQHSRTKHIAVRYHFIKEQVENEVVELYFVKTDYQLADIFTKALARERFEFLINRLSMQSIQKS
ncbi:hypothetical protein Tco_0696186 [Tanacetum coccineum]